MFRWGKSNKSTDDGKALGVLKRTLVITAAVTTMMVGSAYAEGNFETVYHVYLGEEKIGVVDDKSVVDSIIDEKVEELKETYPELDLGTGNQLNYVAEKVFRPRTNNDTVEQKIEEELAIMAEAAALTLDGEIIGYVQSEEKADEVMKKFKLQFISEEELEAFEARKEAGQAPDMKDEDSYIKDIRLSEELNIEEGFAKPTDVLTVDEAVKLLRKGTLEEEKHVVKEGEVLGSIAAKYDLKLDQLLELNPGLKEDSVINIDDELNVTVYKPYVDLIVEMEKTVKEKIPYTVETKEDSSKFKGETTVKQEGADGEKKVRYGLVQKNGQTVKKDVLDEEITKEMKEKIVIKGTKVVPSRGTGQFSWPAVGGYISSEYGYRWGRQHKGIDIAGPSNRTIKAADNGRVVFAGWDGAYGNKVVIDHNNGYRTVYAHLSSISVSVGQSVPRGTKIGVMGSTGRSTGVHLHFEVIKNGSHMNPRKVL